MRKLRKTPEILEAYDGTIKEQLKEGIIEEVLEKPTGSRITYLPHQAVVRKDAETTKVRVVYDASAKPSKNARSLNECLHVGPSLTPLLYDVLLRVRMYPIVLLGDVQKASIAEKCFDIWGILKMTSVKSVEPGNNCFRADHNIWCISKLLLLGFSKSALVLIL